MLCVFIWRSVSLGEEMNLVAWFVCSASFNIFSIYLHYFCPKKCSILLHVCVKKKSAPYVGCTQSIYITIYVMTLQLTD